MQDDLARFILEAPVADLRSRRASSFVQGAALGLGLALLTLGGSVQLSACEKTDDGEREMGEATMTIPDPDGFTRLQAGVSHLRDLDLAEGEFLRLLVRQQGIDVVLRLLDPGGQTMIEVDSPSGSRGLEELVTIAAHPGRYRLVVIATGDAEPGQYSVEALDRRLATVADRRWIAADEIFRSGRKSLKAKEYTAARDAFRSTLPVWQELGLGHREAATYEQLGNALVHSDGPAAALDAYELAVSWFRLLDERRQLATNLEKAATYDLQLGYTARAIDRLQEALPIFKEQAHRQGESLCLSRLGFAYLTYGRPREALDHLRQGLVIAEDLGRASLQASLLTDIGKALLTLHRSQEALEHYSQATELYRQTETAAGLEVALIGLANAAVQLEDPDRAEKDLDKAMELLGPQGSPRIHAALLIARSHVHRLRQEPDKARRILEEAQTVAKAAEDPQIEAEVLLNRGYLEVKSGSSQRGLELHDRAFELYERSGQTIGMASSRARAAEALLALDQPEEAWKRLEPAIDEVERFRAATLQRDHRLSFFGSFRQDYFELAREILLRLHVANPEAGYDRKAFDIDERRRARELLDSLAFRGAEPGIEDAELRERERHLVQELRDAAKGSSRDVSRETGLVIAELHRLRARALPAPSVESSPVTDLDHVQQELLDDATLLLIYSMGKERSVVWSVTRDKLRYYFLQDRESVGALVRRFNDLLVKWSRHREDSRRELGQELSRILLAPVADLLANRRVVIVADGELQTLPFAALPEPGVDGDDVFLVRRHEIVFLPSISTLVQLRRLARERPDGRRFAIFADPVFEADDPRVSKSGATQRAVETGMSQTLSRSAEDLRLAFPPTRLPASGEEGRRIFELAGGNEHLLALDFAASLETFHRTDWERFAVLHIATHAWMHPQPELSGVLLSLVDEQGGPQEGFLPAVEVSQLHLPLDLVVLSACETGDGPTLRGEGVLGLAWVFLDAGAARVIASLWSVGDKRTAELMTTFYEEHLRHGLSPTAALRRAQLRMSEKPGATPVDWAGFVIQGDWR